MSANPFLMDDVDYGAPAGGGSSNPFLSNADFEVPAMAENPFLSAMGGAADQVATSQFMAAGTNPFAAFTAPEQAEDAVKPANFFGNEARASIPELGTPYPQPYEGQIAPQPDMFQVRDPEPHVRHLPSTLDLNKGEQDTDYCMETSEIFSNASGGQSSEPTSGLSSPNKGGPRRLPPPRPVPPSQETKNLILSVTGAMEATSSHLLDRLPPTRTPSPTLIRDLQTPSPTPEAGFSDFLDVSGGAAPDTTGTAVPQAQEVNLLGDLEDEIPTSTAPAPIPSELPPTEAEAPRRPPPPGRPAGGPPVPQRNVSDIMDLFEAPSRAVQETVDLLGSAITAPTGTIFDMGESAPPVEQATFDPVTPVPEPEPEPVVESAATALPVQKLSSPPVPSAVPPSALPGPPPKPPPPARPAPPPITALTQQPPVQPNPPVEQSVSFPVQEPADIFNASAAQPPAPEPLPAPAPIPPKEQSPPKGTDEIMNLFGADQAAANAFSSAPVQMTDDFFGSGGGFAIDQPPAAPPPAASPTSAFGAPFAPPPAAAPGPAGTDNDFDVFTAKFESAGTTTLTNDPFDPFAGSGGGDAFGGGGNTFGGGGDAFGGGGDAFGGEGDAFGGGGDAWGTSAGVSDNTAGFGGEETFDEFLSLRQTPKPISRTVSGDSDDQDFSVVIRPKEGTASGTEAGGFVPALAPPPKPADTADVGRRFNPFDKGGELSVTAVVETVRPATPPEPTFQRTDSQETPPTPLFDDDVSQPLEDFPRIKYTGPGWDMHLRQPNRKKITGQRFWKKIFIRLVYQGENPVLQLLNTANDKDPFQELPLQPCYCVSDISAQQYDQYGKIFTIKLQYVFYKERPGVRPGQVTKAERITNKLSQFAAYAIQGDYQGCKEFASDLKKLGMPVEHAPQISQLFKIGSQTYEDMKQFSVIVEEALFRLPAHRDRALSYKQEEVQITAVDEISVEQDKTGHVCKQIARVRLFFLGFLSGMPDVELGVNDLWRQGKEVVGRHDIIPVVTEEWIRLEAVEFHSCIQQDEYENTRTIKFKPPDACYIELMRFRVRPPRNRELPLQLKVVINVVGNKVDLRADILVPGFSSRKYGQIPCEDVCVRIPIPECWIYLFRVEKHFRYGSVKSAHRRTGKIKGIERFLGAVDTLEQSLMEVTSGQAKYEHQHRSIVWRMPRLPKEGQGAYTTHNLVCHMNLTSFDQIPPELTKYAFVEFTMPQTQVSHTTVRSVSITNSPSDDPPEKYVRQLARHEYRVEIEHTKGEGPGAYIAATISKPVAAEPIREERPPGAAESDSDSSD